MDDTKGGVAEFMKKNTVTILIGLLLILGLLVIVNVFVYVFDRSIYNSVLTSLDEISHQQEMRIESAVEDEFGDAERILVSLALEKCADIGEAQKLLSRQIAGYKTKNAGLVTKDGRIFLHDGRVIEGSALIGYMEKGRSFMIGLDGARSGIGSEEEEQLFFGVPSSLFIGGEAVTGLFISEDYAYIENMLDVSIGSSALVRSDGHACISPDGLGIGEVQGSVFDAMEDEGRITSADRDSIRSAIREHGSYTWVMDPANENKKQMVYLHSLGNVSWELLVMLPYAVYAERSRRMIHYVQLALIIIAAAFLAFFTYLFLRMRRAMADEAEYRARSGFLSTMSHEIRTPLNGIIGLNHLMQQHLDDKEKLVEYTGKMAGTSRYLLSLINDILDVSKLQAGKVELLPESVALESVIDNVRSIEQNAMDSHELSFKVEHSLIEPFVEIDVVRLEQVLINILGNAVKFTPPGGSVTLTVSQRPPENGRVTTFFEIRDTGVGMSKEFIEKIFDAFTQDRSANKQSQKGTGLGMTISHEIMKLMGGDITVESREGEGSVFTVILPAPVSSHEKLMAAIDGKASAPALEKEALKVLVAEDNELNAEILMEILDEAGIKATLAVNGVEAVRLFNESAPYSYDVILMDIQMPELDGYEATRLIRKLEREDAARVRIFACSANTFREDEEKAVEAGMDGYITKPVDIPKLYSMLNIAG